MFDVELCPYKDVCSLYGNVLDCNAGCQRYIEMISLLELSRIPKAYYRPKSLRPEKQDIEVFKELKKYKDNIAENIEKGNNLYLFSKNVGNGKTSWAIKIMMSYFDRIWAGNGGKPRGCFLPISKFIDEIKDNITLQDDTVIQAKDLYREVDLLILDDIGTVKKTDFNMEQIFNIVDDRFISEKTTIYTSNVTPENLHTVLGTRLASRVLGNSLKLEIKGGDNR